MAFTPRTTAPEVGDFYYYSGNPYYTSGYGMPNCTCYAWGRAYEILRQRPRLSLHDAENWYPEAEGIYVRRSYPSLGDILCFADGSFSGKGHVCVVEALLPNGKIRTSNSASGGQYWYEDTHSPSNNYAPSLGTGYVFQGFIHIYDEPIPPTPTPTRREMPLYMKLRRNYYV